MAAYRSDRRAHCISLGLLKNCFHLPRHKDPPHTKSTPTRQEIIYLCKCFGVLEEKSEFNLYFIFNGTFLCKFMFVVQRNSFSKAIFYSTSFFLKTNNIFRTKQQPSLFIVVCLCTLPDKSRVEFHPITGREDPEGR